MKQNATRTARGFTVKVSEFINHNTGWLIATAIVFFGLTTIGFQKDNTRILNGLDNSLRNTQSILSKQDETLTAIQKVTTDTQLTAEQQTNIIICMLQVPIEERSTDLQTECRKRAAQISASTPRPVVQSSEPEPTPSEDNGGRTMSPTPVTPSAPEPELEEEPEPTGIRRIPLVDGLLNRLGL